MCLLLKKMNKLFIIFLFIKCIMQELNLMLVLFDHIVTDHPSILLNIYYKTDYMVP